MASEKGVEPFYFIPYAAKSIGDYQLVGVDGAATFVSMMLGEALNPADPTWHHVVLAWDSAAISSCLDGVLKKT